MSDGIRTHLNRRRTWVRALYMLLFALIWTVAEVVLFAVAFLQLGFLLVTGGASERLLGFGADLSLFLYQVMLFLTFNSEDLPFPFNPWPSGEQSIRPNL